MQAKEFSETAGVTGVVLTKLDGTGKGGCFKKCIHFSASFLFYLNLFYHSFKGQKFEIKV